MEPDIKYWLDQGREFFKNKAYKKAESIFRRIISGQNEYADVYNMLGIIYHQTGQFSDAVESLKHALDINPRYTEAMLNLSVLYNDLGEYSQSRKLLEQFKKESKKSRDPIDPFVKSKLANKHAEVGDLYRGIGLFKRAVEEYAKALDLAPHYHDIRTRMGICLREEGQKAEALKELQKVLKEKPDYIDAQAQLGLTYYALGKMNDAKKVWQGIAAKKATHPLVSVYLKLVEGGNGKKNNKK